LYPEPGKLKKQFEYAAKRHAPIVVIVGEEEIKTGLLTVKDQQSGAQTKMTLEELAARLK
jgi:histidyl-tRNA synthetase